MIRFWSYVSRRRLTDGLAGAVVGAAVTAAALLLLPEAAPPPAAPPSPQTASLPGLRATALDVVDGDTFEARVQAFPGQEIVARVRIDGVDTPERRGRCAVEIASAEAAREALADLLRDRPLTLTGVRGDKYFGRVVARVTASGVGDVAETLIKAGHGRAYAGGRRTGWC
ncbi:nuclease [Methylopila sp. Yamaguchi]|nr:nuclease [Methylopila sp. Yamaguchi]